MRGLLWIALLGAAVLGLTVSVVLPAVVAGILTAGIGSAGLVATDTVVVVHSDPPWDLLGLRADQVQVRATHATFRGLSVDQVALDLGGVGLLDRSVATVAGRLDGLILPDRTGRGIRLPVVTLSGSGSAVTVATTIPAAAAQLLVADEVASIAGVRPSSVSLAAPNRVTVRLGATVTGQLALDDAGNLVVVLDQPQGGAGSVVLFHNDGSLPFRITVVAVTADGSLHIEGELNSGLLG